MTPLKLQILLRIYICAYLPESESERLSAHATALRELLEAKAVEFTRLGYNTTDLGRAWVEEILATPMPRLQYVGASGKVYPAA